MEDRYDRESNACCAQAGAPPTPFDVDLTQREAEVLDDRSQDCAYKEIANFGDIQPVRIIAIVHA